MAHVQPPDAQHVKMIAASISGPSAGLRISSAALPRCPTRSNIEAALSHSSRPPTPGQHDRHEHGQQPIHLQQAPMGQQERVENGNPGGQ